MEGTGSTVVRQRQASKKNSAKRETPNLPATIYTIDEAAFARDVLRWFRRYGRHDLPWQQNRDPYSIWVSEIMLQQTQVATVIPYYRRFIKRFPDIQRLARAKLDSVLDHWTGLGYYARARNLHRAAQLIEREHGGCFPDRFDEVVALPGIGRSTAGAILSFAHHQVLPILDGNVRRVLARAFAITGDTSGAKGQQVLWSIVERLLPRKGSAAAAFNQAMMDLGAMICVQRHPACDQCPLRRSCRALALGAVGQFPQGRPARARPVRKSRLLILQDPLGRVLLERRPAEGIWGGLWCFPQIDLESKPEAWCRRALGIRARLENPGAMISHGFTHFVLELYPSTLTVSRGAADKVVTSGRQWIDPGRPGRKGLAAPIKILLNQLDKKIDDKDR